MTRRQTWLWLMRAYRLGRLYEIADAYLKRKRGVGVLLDNPFIRARLRPEVEAAIREAIHERVACMLPSAKKKEDRVRTLSHASRVKLRIIVEPYKCEAPYDDDNESEPFC